MITPEEWSEMNALKLAINDNPASVHPDKMERFSELFVKSISKYSECIPSSIDKTSHKET